MHADQNALLADEDQIVGVVDDLDRRHAALGIVADALAAAVGHAVIVDAAAAALAVLGNGQHGGAGPADADAHHVIALRQADGPHAAAGAAHGPGAGLGKVDGHAVVGGHDQLVIAAGQVAPGQRVALVQADGDQARLADVLELAKRRALDQALPGDHGDIAVFLVDVGGLAHHDGDLLVILQLQQVDDVGALGGPGPLRHLVALQPVDAALVGHEQHIVMAGTDKQLLGKVLVLVAQAGDAAAAAVLGGVGIGGGALDIARMGQGVDALLLRDQVLDVHLAGDSLDGGAALVAVLFLHGQQLVLQNGLDPAVVGQDLAVIRDACVQLVQFVLDLFDLQAGQASQREAADGLGLHIVKAELLHDGGFCLGLAAAAVADGVNDLVHNVHGPLQAFQDMAAVLGLFQLKLGAAADDLVLEVHIPLHHALEGHDLGGLVVQRQHDDAHCVLQLGIAVKLVQDHLGVGVLFHFNDDAHALAAGLVVQVADALDLFVLDIVGDGLDQAGLVDHVGDLGDDDLKPAVFLLDDLGAAAQRDLAAAGGVGGADAGAAHDDAAGGEIGALDILHQAGQVDVRVVDQRDDAVDDFPQVVGRDIGGHAHRDALAAVDQQVGEAAGQHAGFLFGLVKVQRPVDGLLVDVGQHVAGDLAHAGLGITVSGRGVAVHRAEVALAVHQRVPHAEILGQTHHGVVDAGVAVGVIAAQHGADGVGGLFVGVLGVIVALVHGVQDAPVHGFQAVAHVGQRAGDDDRHGVIQKRGLDLLLDVAHNDLGTGPRHHHDIFFHLCTTFCLGFGDTMQRF